LGKGHSNNHWGKIILEQLSESPEESWVGHSWRHYLSWFGKVERQLTANKKLVRSWLKTAEKNWEELDEEDFLFDEAKNDGSWIRRWRQSLARFKKSNPD
jgi:hypothetical protein